MSQPLVIRTLSSEAADDPHGATIALGNPVVLRGFITTTAVMGVAVETCGIKNSFYVIGREYLLATGVLAAAAWKPALITSITARAGR